MKTFLFVLIALCSLSAQQVSACMPPAPGVPSIQLQRPWFAKLFNDPVVKAKVEELAGQQGMIKSISMASSGFQIDLTNKCTIVANTDDTGASVGTCPIMLPLKIVSENCL
jgi:hypothetical protein